MILHAQFFIFFRKPPNFVDREINDYTVVQGSFLSIIQGVLIETIWYTTLLLDQLVPGMVCLSLIDIQKIGSGSCLGMKRLNI